MGLKLDEVADIARTKTRRKVFVLRNLTSEEFREHIKRSNDLGRRYIINLPGRRFLAVVSGTFPRSEGIWQPKISSSSWM
jgi:hypothetical protein